MPSAVVVDNGTIWVGTEANITFRGGSPRVESEVDGPFEREDETDAEADRFIRRISDDDYFIKALTPIEDFNEHFGTTFSDEEFDTIGGLVTHSLGHLPCNGEEVVLGDIRFHVTKADRRRVHWLQMSLHADSP